MSNACVFLDLFSVTCRCPPFFLPMCFTLAFLSVAGYSTFLIGRGGRSVVAQLSLEGDRDDWRVEVWPLPLFGGVSLSLMVLNLQSSLFVTANPQSVKRNFTTPLKILLNNLGGKLFSCSEIAAMFSTLSPITNATVILPEFLERDCDYCLFCFNTIVVV